MLNADDIVAAIGRMSAQEMDDGAPLATALAELLAQHFADRLADPTRLNARVRLCLAHYFRHTKDPRAGVWYEELLAAPDPGIDTWYVIRGLAAFYRETGEPRRAAETWLRCQESAAMNADRVESARISAARMFASAGDTSTAEETYRRVVDSANPVSVSLARYGLASLLMQQGKHQDARRLLQEPLPGASSETARSLLLSGLTESYYLAGDFAEARRSAKEAHSGALPPPLPEDVQAVLQTAETCVRWIDSWQREPLQSSVAELRIDVKAPGAPAAGAFTVRSFRGVPLVVTTDWPQLAALAVPLPNRGNPYAVEREVKVTVEAAGTKADRDATVSITSPAIPGAELRIRVKLVLHASGR